MRENGRNSVRTTVPDFAHLKQSCIGRAEKSCSSGDPANPAPAGEAFLTAIAVAKQQATRSFELRAALSLARLYQSTARLADAHAVLAGLRAGLGEPQRDRLADAGGSAISRAR